jgi:malate dehydrogenase
MKVTIVGGAGGVGASAAFNLLLLGDALHVVLVDRRPEMIASHVMDLEQALALAGGGASISGGDAGDLADADVLVVTAAVPLTLNTSRLVYLADNAAIVGEVLDALPEGWDGVLVLVTNPVDPLCTWGQGRTGIDRRRLVGYTLNDSLRLRSGIGEALGVAGSRVDAWVVGEHGDGCVPLWDRVRVDGSPTALGDEQRARAEEFLRTWYVRHVALDSGRTSTWTSGAGVARMVAAIVRDSGELWPASVVLDGEYGVDGLALSVPVSLGRGGVREIHEWTLTPGQAAAFERAAGVVGDVTRRIDAGSVVP